MIWNLNPIYLMKHIIFYNFEFYQKLKLNYILKINHKSFKI
jgi:hypothetical protein